MNLSEECRSIASEARRKSQDNRRLSSFAADKVHYMQLAHDFEVLAVKIEGVANCIEIERSARRSFGEVRV